MSKKVMLIISIAVVVGLAGGTLLLLNNKVNKQTTVIDENSVQEDTYIESEDDEETCTGAVTSNEYGNLLKKPVIYLYPDEEIDVNVTLDFDGDIVCTYPKYSVDGWNVTARPDGTLINKSDNKEYSYLFWEGATPSMDFDLTKGFVVKGKDTAEFLREKLLYMGLTIKECDDFIVYWLPEMEKNPYNLITFQGVTYTDKAVLNIEPKPDSMLRVFMVYKPLEEYTEIPTQDIESFERKGFTVVEWGGCNINN